jgi:hypothetical protein
MTDPVVLYSKKGFIFTKNEKNNYSLSFSIENNSIVLPKIIDFNLIKLIYDLNNDVYEKIDINIVNENEAIAILLMKHLFKDLGLPQRFCYARVNKIVQENNIRFIAQTIKTEFPKDMPINAELTPLKNMICDFFIITPHQIQFICNVQFENSMSIPPVVEKLVGLILFKIFSRIKQFIENLII